MHTERHPLLSRALLVFALLLAGTGLAAAAGGVSPGQPAPPIAGKDLGGKPVDLAKLRGKVVIIDFWASWCAPCKEEMPVLEKLYKKYGKHGLTVLGVSVDEEAGNARKFIDKLGVSFPSIHDADHGIAERYKPAKMPTSIIVDKQGTVRFVHAGFHAKDAKKIEKEIRSLLK